MLQWPSKDAETSKCFHTFTHPSTSGMPLTQDHFCSINANQVHSILKEINQIRLILEIFVLFAFVYSCVPIGVWDPHTYWHTLWVGQNLCNLEDDCQSCCADQL